MFGRKKDAEHGVDFADTMKDHDDLDIPAPKSGSPRPLSTSPRVGGSAGGLEPARRTLSASPPRPRPDAAGAPQAGSPVSLSQGEPDVASPPAPVPQGSSAVTVPAAPTAAAESKQLVVGREIRLKGEVTSCDVLVVEGAVELSLTDARQIQVATSGRFSGTVEVDEADIAGEFDGELTVRERLVVRTGGKVQGHIRYGTIVIESGGHVTGEIEALSAGAGRSGARASAPSKPSRPPLSAPDLNAARPAGPGNGGLPPADFEQAAEDR